MNVPLERARLNQLSGAVIGAAQKVSSTLGYGFLEKVYENALCLELRKCSIERPHRQQCLNYLRASNLSLGLILNFGHAHLEAGRVVYHF